MGKDVMWLPTNDDLVHQLLEVAKVGPSDEVVDLGAGDGKIPIAAAKSFKELHKLRLFENKSAKLFFVCILKTNLCL